MKYTLIFFSLLFSVASFSADHAYIEGKIKKIHTGADKWYGVRFHVGDRTKDTSEGICNAGFIYTEPDDWGQNAHSNKVSVFLAAYMAGKKVYMTAVEGRNGYCKLFEGNVSG